MGKYKKIEWWWFLSPFLLLLFLWIWWKFLRKKNTTTPNTVIASLPESVVATSSGISYIPVVTGGAFDTSFDESFDIE